MILDFNSSVPIVILNVLGLGAFTEQVIQALVSSSISFLTSAFISVGLARRSRLVNELTLGCPNTL